MYFTAKKDESVVNMKNCPISMKFSTELARYIKGKPTSKVLVYLNDVKELKRHVPLKNFNADVGHKRGEAVEGTKSGRYPIRVAEYFEKAINSALKNADAKGLNAENMLIAGAVVSIGVRRFKRQPNGQRRVRRSKATNIEILLKEMKGGKKSDSITKSKVESKVE